jgi:hypothetical protein
MKPYYKILRIDGGREPKVKHATLEGAQAEALRLAGQHPGSAFEILQCLAVAQTAEPSIFWCDGVVPPNEAPATRYPTTPLPEGFDRWECRGPGWSSSSATFTTGYVGGEPNWDQRHTTGSTGAYSRLEYWEAVKDAPTYRMLEAGEVIEEGDEFLVAGSDNEWLKRQLNIGQPWHPELYSATRRPINNSKP